MTGFYLVTVGLAEYHRQPIWAVSAAAGSRAKVESLLRAHGASVEDWTCHAVSSQINRKLAKWAERWNESHVLYWTGHGEYNQHGYFLALADSEKLAGNFALSDYELFSALQQLAVTRRANDSDAWVLVILDTCGSGSGSWDIFTKFKPAPKNVGIIGTTGDGAAYSGRFPEILEVAVNGFSGNDTDGIPLRDLLRRIEDRLDTDWVNGKFDSYAMLPHRADVSPAVQATVDVYAELREVLAGVPAEIRNHFYAKAQGAEIGEPAWNFAGRVAERRILARWLRDAENGMFVVSGIAGSGKSALVGMMLATSDQRVRDALHAAGYAPIPNDLQTGDLSYQAVVHLSGRTIADAVSALAAGLELGSEVTGPDQLVDSARSRAENGAAVGRTTVLVDALDEACDPLTIASLLRRLASLPGHRILISTRQSLREDPDNPVPPDSAVLDVLAADPEHLLKLARDPDAVQDYVASRLRRAKEPELADHIDAIANRIAAQDQPFLFARLAVHEIIADPAIAFSEPRLADLLSAGHSGVFGKAVARLAAQAPDVEALLHALAYARGAGFPRTDGIWQIAASILTDVAVTD